MTIRLICKYAFPESTGFGTRHFGMAREWVLQGHEVEIITSTTSHVLPEGRVPLEERRPVIDGIRVSWVRTPRESSGFSLLRIASWLVFEAAVVGRMLFRPPPDILIASSLSFLTLATSAFLKWYYRCYCVVEVRDIWPFSLEILSGVSSNGLLCRGLRSIERFAYESADLIVGTMPNLAEHVRSYCVAWGNKVVHVGQGRTIQSLGTDVPLAEVRQGVLAMVYAGRLNRNNPIESVMAAVGQNVTCCLTVIGEGTELVRLRQLAGAVERVSFEPFMPRSALRNHLTKYQVGLDAIDHRIGRFGLSRNKWVDYGLAGCHVLCIMVGTEHINLDANELVTYCTDDPEDISRAMASILSRICQGGLSRKIVAEAAVREYDYSLLARKYIGYIQVDWAKQADASSTPEPLRSA